MKYKTSIVRATFFIAICYAGSCSKQSTSATTQLPPITNKGLNTFGCTVNGKIFIPQRPTGDITPYYTCTYQRLYADTSKPYGFTVTGKDKNSSCDQRLIVIGLDSIKLIQGSTYELTSYYNASGLALPGKKHGSYSISTSATCQFNTYNTTESVIGQITINFLDEVNQIVSGIFWFDAINNSNDTVQVREGRFDMHYTQ